MEHLLTQYSVSEVVIFLVVLFFAAKEFVQSFDWAKDRLRKYYQDENHCDEAHKELHDRIDGLTGLYDEHQKIKESLSQMRDLFEKINVQIDLLTESDKEAIKAYITERHHFFIYDRGWIDNYSLECIEKRFAIYEKEHGNSFVGQLMEDIRELPRQPIMNKITVTENGEKIGVK